MGCVDDDPPPFATQRIGHPANAITMDYAAMASQCVFDSPRDLWRINDFIHDCWFDVEDIILDKATSILSVMYLADLRDKASRKWWNDFFDSSSRKRPRRECYLRIRNVEDYTIRDTQRVGCYDFNVLKFDLQTSTIVFHTGIPIEISVQVRNFEISIEETDNILGP